MIRALNVGCLQLFQFIEAPPSVAIKPAVTRRLSVSPAQSKLVYMASDLAVGVYKIEYDFVPFRCQSSRFVAFARAWLGLSRYCDSLDVVQLTSSRVAVMR